MQFPPEMEESSDVAPQVPDRHWQRAVRRHPLPVPLQRHSNGGILAFAQCASRLQSSVADPMGSSGCVVFI